MARPLRVGYLGTVCHATSRGNRRGGIFIDSLSFKPVGEVCASVRIKYREFVNDGNARNIWDDILAGVVLYGEDFEVLNGLGGKGKKWLRAVGEFGYTQKEVAQQCGVHCSYVSRVLKRERSKVKT